ncbi:hypothetical protein BRADI_1g66896v3 [Brachypodium distachyon]|uniref:Uncharacterized protein n=1 Tax=Brachypodium distachyon TaxID=15368 RepID=A0A2K2DTT3_BRADI|nr:hypothetical protein BRADI_1g66896v3 [Brachypodium distachyon]
MFIFFPLALSSLDRRSISSLDLPLLPSSSSCVVAFSPRVRRKLPWRRPAPRRHGLSPHGHVCRHGSAAVLKERNIGHQKGPDPSVPPTSMRAVGESTSTSGQVGATGPFCKNTRAVCSNQHAVHLFKYRQPPRLLPCLLVTAVILLASAALRFSSLLASTAPPRSLSPPPCSSTSPLLRSSSSSPVLRSPPPPPPPPRKNR